MTEVEEREVTVEIPKEERKAVSAIKIKIPEGMELSEEELKRVVSATQNEIVDVLRGTKAKGLMAGLNVKEREKYEVAKAREKEVVWPF